MLSSWSLLGRSPQRKSPGQGPLCAAIPFCQAPLPLRPVSNSTSLHALGDFPRAPKGRIITVCLAGQGPKASGKYVPSFMPPSLAAAVNRDGGSTASSSGFSSARNGVSKT